MPGRYDGRTMNVQDGYTAVRALKETGSTANQTEIVDESFRTCPRARKDMVWEFNGREQTFDVYVPLFSNNATTQEVAQTPTASGELARGLAIMPRAGRLLTASIAGEDTLAANDTNYLTFAITNKQAGSGAVAMLAATDPNTTKVTGGSAWTAHTERSLTISGTAAALQAVKGDVIECKATVTGTAANVVECPMVKLTFATIPFDLEPRVARVAGSPLVGPLADTAYGAITGKLEATSEAQVTGFDFGDQLIIPATRRPYFAARLQISGVAASTRFVFGFADGYNATFDSTTYNAWFRVEGNALDLYCEADDNTTNTDDTDTGYNLVADTDVFLEVMIVEGKAKFFINGQFFKEIAVKDFAVTHKLQPVCWLQKDSGTGVESFNCSYLRVSFDTSGE